MKAAIKLVVIVCAALLASGLGAQEAELPASGEQPTAPAQPAAVPQPAAVTEPSAEDGVAVETVTSYLDKMNYVYKVDKSAKVPEIELLMRGNNGNYDVRVFIDNPRKIVYVWVNRLMTIPDLHPRKYVLLQKLMELNWELLIGKYEWDKSDGEVRVSYTFSTENGVGYDAFVACFQLLVLTADRDYPKLMQLMWGSVEQPSAPAATLVPPENKPEEAAISKETEPKPDTKAKESEPKPEAPENP